MTEDYIEEELEAQIEKKNGMTTREKTFAGVAAVGVIAAVLGFGLYFANSVPSGAAAKIDNEYMSEQRVAEWIDQYRKVYGLTDDQAFADALVSQNMTVVSFRQNAIDQLAISDMYENRAKELGITVTDEEVQERLGSVSGQISGDDNSLWATTLESMGITEDDLKSRYRSDIIQEKVCEVDVPVEDATADELNSYVTSYLADSTQKHVYHIVFSSDDGKTKVADKCLAELEKLEDSGKLDEDAFEAAAKKYSEEEGVKESGGEIGWTGSGKIGTEVSEVISDMKAGDMSGLTTVEADDGALEIIYVDKTFTFPAAESIVSVSSLKVPSDLLDLVSSAAANAAWQVKCTTYTNNLLANAKITYYPVPDNATYKVVFE